MFKAITLFKGTVPGETGNLKTGLLEEGRQRQTAQEMPVLKAIKGS